MPEIKGSAAERGGGYGATALIIMLSVVWLAAALQWLLSITARRQQSSA
jgi:hypothetical protein